MSIYDDLRQMYEKMTPIPAPIEFVIRDAQQQMRTTRDVKGPWVRPKVPSKTKGRRGTRRAFKRRHPPHQTWLYREPTDILVLAGSARIRPFERPGYRGPDPADLYFVTPAQYRAIEAQAAERGLTL